MVTRVNSCTQPFHLYLYMRKINAYNVLYMYSYGRYHVYYMYMYHTLQIKQLKKCVDYTCTRYM